MSIHHITPMDTLLWVALLVFVLAGLTWLSSRRPRRCRFCGVVRHKSLMEKHVGLWFCGEGWHHWLDWQEIVGKLQEQTDETVPEQRPQQRPSVVGADLLTMAERKPPARAERKRAIGGQRR